MNHFGLKPCPFCGSEDVVIFQIGESEPKTYGVDCLNCYAVLEFTAGKDVPINFQPFVDIEKTKQAWNRRAKK